MHSEHAVIPTAGAVPCGEGPTLGSICSVRTKDNRERLFDMCRGPQCTHHNDQVRFCDGLGQLVHCGTVAAESSVGEAGCGVRFEMCTLCVRPGEAWPTSVAGPPVLTGVRPSRPLESNNAPNRPLHMQNHRFYRCPLTVDRRTLGRRMDRRFDARFTSFHCIYCKLDRCPLHIRPLHGPLIQAVEGDGGEGVGIAFPQKKAGVAHTLAHNVKWCVARCAPTSFSSCSMTMTPLLPVLIHMTALILLAVRVWTNLARPDFGAAQHGAAQHCTLTVPHHIPPIA
eukprot:gene20781-biopygen11626